MASKAIVTLRLKSGYDSIELRNWAIASDARSSRLLLLGFLWELENLLPAVKPVGRDMVTPVRDTRGGIDR
jgi:hypothetical protein